MPSEVAAAGAHHVTTALRRASAATGAGFEFLAYMAARESSMNPDAKAQTSSAAGLFQFIEQTWLGAVKQFGARHGLETFAADIARGADGRFDVADGARREEILNLRFDASASAKLAGEMATENGAFLEKHLGRAASAADLYAAHFLGPAGAVKLLSAGAGRTAAELFPQAAKANRAVFYDGTRAKSVGEVVASIAQSMGEGAKTTEPAPQAAITPAPPLRIEAANAPRASDHAKTPHADLRAAPREAVVARPKLSWLALNALNALDPTRLGSRDDADQRHSRVER